MTRNIFIEKIIQNNNLDQLSKNKNDFEKLSTYISRGLDYLNIKFLIENLTKDFLNFNNYMLYDTDICLSLENIYINNNRLYYRIQEKEIDNDSFYKLIKSLLVETRYKEDPSLKQLFALINKLNEKPDKIDLLKVFLSNEDEKKIKEKESKKHIFQLISRFKSR